MRSTPPPPMLGRAAARQWERAARRRAARVAAKGGRWMMPATAAMLRDPRLRAWVAVHRMRCVIRQWAGDTSASALLSPLTEAAAQPHPATPTPSPADDSPPLPLLLVATITAAPHGPTAAGVTLAA